jgi:hypothetical protein
MYSAPISGGGAADGWCAIHPDDFDAVHWTLADAPSLSCNGIKIEDPAMGPYGDRFNWTRDVRVQAPKVAVVDSRGHLPLTVQRYGLAQRTLPFMEELARDVALSFVAHGLVLGPASSADPAVQGYRRTQYPLALGETAPAQPGDSIGPPNLRWCSTALGIVPADPWLYALLRAPHCIVSGGVPFHSDRGLLLKFVHTRAGDTALVHWDIQERSDVPDEGPNDRWVLSKAVSVADTVARYLGQGAVGARVSLFLESGANWEDEEWIEEGAEWRMCEQQPFGRYFELRQGSTEQLPPLRDIADLERFAQHVEEFDNYDVFTETFVAQLQLTNQPHQPESLIARIWNECLGPSIIPFDPASRRALIEKGRQHAELRRHIEYWERTRQEQAPVS